MTQKKIQGIVRSLSESSLIGLNAISSKETTMLRTSIIHSNVSQYRMKHSNFGVNLVIDILIRVAMVIIFIKLETTPAFKRTIHIEELWLYKNPPTKDYVPALHLLLAVILGPLAITFLNFLYTRDRYDFHQSTNAWTLSLGFNGLATSLLKITVGRPRPDYFYRCYPDGISLGNVTADGIYNENCTGIEHLINEGRKSFPSGHASFAFTSFGFISCYLAAKLNVFNEKGRGQSWRLCIICAPLTIASMVAISRTCDYHHHWQDVLVGSLIGLSTSYICYRQYYPTIFGRNCNRPFPKQNSNYISNYDFYSKFGSNGTMIDNNIGNLMDDNESVVDSGGSDEIRPLVDTSKDNKWT